MAHLAFEHAARPSGADFQRWRRRSRLIRALRVALPILIGAVLATQAGYVAYSLLYARKTEAERADAPIRLVNPRFVGRDEKGRAFVVTARSATRDAADYQRVILDQPALVIDEEGPKPTRINGRSGVYHEGTSILNLHGGVQLEGADAAFKTDSSLFDTKSGVLSGAGPIQGSGSLGEINARSYGVYDKGERMVFKGGVRARIDGK